MRSKIKRSYRPTNNKRRRIHLALWLILKALNLKKLKETAFLKRKISMQKMKQLSKIRYQEIRRAGASQSKRQKPQQVNQSAMRLLQANQI